MARDSLGREIDRGDSERETAEGGREEGKERRTEVETAWEEKQTGEGQGDTAEGRREERKERRTEVETAWEEK